VHSGTRHREVRNSRKKGRRGGSETGAERRELVTRLWVDVRGQATAYHEVRQGKAHKPQTRKPIGGNSAWSELDGSAVQRNKRTRGEYSPNHRSIAEMEGGSGGLDSKSVAGGQRGGKTEGNSPGSKVTTSASRKSWKCPWRKSDREAGGLTAMYRHSNLEKAAQKGKVLRLSDPYKPQVSGESHKSPKDVQSLQKRTRGDG